MKVLPAVISLRDIGLSHSSKTKVGGTWSWILHIVFPSNPIFFSCLFWAGQSKINSCNKNTSVVPLNIAQSNGFFPCDRFTFYDGVFWSYCITMYCKVFITVYQNCLSSFCYVLFCLLLFSVIWTVNVYNLCTSGHHKSSTKLPATLTLQVQWFYFIIVLK